MELLSEKYEKIKQLQKEVLTLQKLKRTSAVNLNIGLREMGNAFPDKTFPLGAIHEFISNEKEDAAATNGFMAGLISPLITNGVVIWISNRRTLFPPALSVFGINPERIIFIDLWRPKEVLWALEEALKCGALSAVVGELSELSFTESRRLQLAVEQSRVTGLIHRYNPKSNNVTACVTRWKIESLRSEMGGLPGVGYPRWDVHLQKVRNGKPGTWQVEWSGGCFRHIPIEVLSTPEHQTRKVG